MASPEVFSKRIGRIALKIEGNVEKGLRKAALAIDNALVNTTPFDTGRARSNWLANIDAPASGTVEPTDPGTATARAAAEINKFKVGRNTTIHLTNNLPYIVRLDQGWSEQRPAGFVKRAVLAGLRAVKSIKLLR